MSDAKTQDIKLARFSLLVAEDDEMLREALVEEATTAGFRVTIAADGLEARAKAEKQAFDAILIDMNLPKMLGHEVIAQIRAESPSKRAVIVVLSGYLKKEVVQAIAGKVDKAFTKPADIEQVIVALLSFVQKKAAA